MTDDDLDDDALEALFRTARGEATPPRAEWLARVAADAGAEAGRRARMAAAARKAPGLWSQLHTALGGWRGLGGLVAASATGLWIGIAPPEALEAALGGTVDGAIAAALGGAEAFGLLPVVDPGLAGFLEEG